MTMKPNELCMALMRADSEAEIIDLLKTAGYWDDRQMWRLLGDNENNFSSIGNQQSEAVAALIEKLVNGVDARLTNACYVAGTDPTSGDAPQSIREAVARFFEGRTEPELDEKAGHIALWSDADATAEGRLLTLAATGYMPSEGLPSISIADQGEGQTPDSFPDTFMSIGRSNKLRIPFVQGKFNMGGTGALQFCGGHHRLQLVVSRRNPALLGPQNTTRDAEWGFTVVRREPPSPGSRSSVFTYLAPIDAGTERRGRVLSLAAEGWPIFPEADASIRDAYARNAPYGSLVKLYEYGWQGGTRSNIVSSGGGLLRRVDLGLVEVALPVRVFECRPQYRGHSGSFATNVLGLAARLEQNKADVLEPEFPIGSIITLEGRQVRVRVFAFKKGKATEYRTAKHGLVFAVNGQTHATFPIDFFRRKSVGMSYLADSLLVMIDCTSIEGEMREDLFMNSRDRLRSNSVSEQLENEIEDYIKNDPTLRALRNRRREEDLANKLSDSKPLANVLEELMRQSPSLAKLFLEGVKLSSPFPLIGTGAGSGGEFVGKTYPTFFRFKGLKDDEPLHRDAHLGTRVRVAFETDAQDEYFHRELDPGTAIVRQIRGEAVHDLETWRVRGPKGGAATFTFDLPVDAHQGKDLTFLFEVTDASRVEPFVNCLVLRVRPKATSTGGNGGAGQTATGGKGNTGGAGGLTLPNIVEVEEAGWADHDFTENTALVIKHTGEGETQADVYDFFVNVDNKYLRIAEKDSAEEAKLLKARFVYSLVLVGLALIQHDRSLSRDSDSAERESTSVEDIVASVSTALAPVMIPMIETIGSLSLDADDN